MDWLLVNLEQMFNIIQIQNFITVCAITLKIVGILLIIKIVIIMFIEKN